MHIKKLSFSAVLVALGLMLPFLTLQTVALGNMFSLMHIPILLCGFVCGWPYGLAVGAITPLLRNLLFGMPPFPKNIAMAAELATYGLLTGLFYKLFPKKPIFLYVGLMLAMLCGRFVWGGVMACILPGFTFSAFWISAFANAVPGIVCHIILVPPLVLALQKSGFLHARDI